MDAAVLRALAKWPQVPDVYGWLALDRRGEWRIKDERIGNAALRAFICRNYAADARGCWYFQNGPQKVFVQLAYTPLIARLETGKLFDHCGRPFGQPRDMWLDEEGSLLLEGATGVALLDDRDLAAYAELQPGSLAALPRLARGEVAGRFGFVTEPRPQA
jgi:DUF2946 family protein